MHVTRLFTIPTGHDINCKMGACADLTFIFFYKFVAQICKKVGAIPNDMYTFLHGTLMLKFIYFFEYFISNFFFFNKMNRSTETVFSWNSFFAAQKIFKHNIFYTIKLLEYVNDFLKNILKYFTFFGNRTVFKINNAVYKIEVYIKCLLYFFNLL